MERARKRAERRGWTFGRYLHHLAELEVEERTRRRIERHLKASDLPAEKTLATLDRARLPAKVSACRRCARAASSSAATTSSRSVCPGAARRTSARSATSSSSAATACCSPRRRAGAAAARGQAGPAARERAAPLDAFDAVILDDIGYVQQSRDEMEVLFTFLAERYERRSVIITSNLVFRSGTGSSRTR